MEYLQVPSPGGHSSRRVLHGGLSLMPMSADLLLVTLSIRRVIRSTGSVPMLDTSWVMVLLLRDTERMEVAQVEAAQGEGCGERSAGCEQWRGLRVWGRGARSEQMDDVGRGCGRAVQRRPVLIRQQKLLHLCYSATGRCSWCQGRAGLHDPATGWAACTACMGCCTSRHLPSSNCSLNSSACSVLQQYCLGSQTEGEN
jgi:hypothetical protein